MLIWRICYDHPWHAINDHWMLTNLPCTLTTWCYHWLLVIISGFQDLSVCNVWLWYFTAKSYHLSCCCIVVADLWRWKHTTTSQRRTTCWLNDCCERELMHCRHRPAPVLRQLRKAMWNQLCHRSRSLQGFCQVFSSMACKLQLYLAVQHAV